MIGRADFLALTAGRWLAPLLAHLHQEGGSRFAAMLAALGSSRSALAASLDQVQAAMWVTRNSGHGHPLRPEYLLTEHGAPVAAFARKMMTQRELLGLEPGQLTRWSMPVISRLDPGPARFSALHKSLRPITPRALSLTLKRMLAIDLIERRLKAGFPPVAIYQLTARGRRLAEVMR